MTDCVDVCEIVVDMLLAMGFEIDTENEDHADILTALEQVKLIRA